MRPARTWFLALLAATVIHPATRAESTAAAETELRPPDSPPRLEVVNAFPELRFRRPLYLGAPPDDSDRIFVLEQQGRVLWFENRPDVRPGDVHVALDITGRVRSPTSRVRGNRGHNEEGLLGMAFHPNFAENRQVFLHYSETGERGEDYRRYGVISRFTMDRNLRRIEERSEEVILRVGQFAGNHNGGGIEFGPDGYLYISFGDGGGAGDPQRHGQNLQTLLAAMLRIDVDRTDGDRKYAIPADNPFVGRADALDEIWAYGLRNVWRFAFDSMTGSLWAGDVCQNAREKVMIIERGANYGWPWLEGTRPYHGVPDDVDPDSITPPIMEHDHPQMQSVTGGIVYRGKALPELYGAYVYGDYVSGLIFALWHDQQRGENIAHHRLGNIREISSFGTDTHGELYIVSLAGQIYRLEAVE